MLAKEGLDRVACRKLGLNTPEADLREWEKMVAREEKVTESVTIGLVGKYTALHDSYLSVIESLSHAGTENDIKVDVKWIDAERITDENAAQVLAECHGILVPGGFGDRGIEGMISAVRYAREYNVPYFGICLGMQMAVIEFARHLAGLTDAHSAEFDAQSNHPVIDLMADQRQIKKKAVRCGSVNTPVSFPITARRWQPMEAGRYPNAIDTVTNSIMITEAYLLKKDYFSQGYHRMEASLR